MDQIEVGESMMTHPIVVHQPKYLNPGGTQENKKRKRKKEKIMQVECVGL